MTVLFVVVFLVLIAAELVKSLCAKGAPPILQKYPQKLNLTYVMCTNIVRLRVGLCAALAAIWVLSGFPLARVL